MTCSSLLRDNSTFRSLLNCSTVSKQCIAVSELHHTATGNHMRCGITQCYLPPGSCDLMMMMMMMMKLPILPCAEKLELVLSTAPKT